ncbi:MAG: histidine phosphatase family protein [Actinomycetota bacterium]|nr:histidine phosphatase family protein [Actinomycetota bacterium]
MSEEDPSHFTTRVVTAIEDIVADHAGGVAAAVCHGGVINTYLAHVLDRPGRRPFFAPNYTSIHRIAASRRGARQIISLNETAHLRGTGLPTGLFDRA